LILIDVDDPRRLTFSSFQHLAEEAFGGPRISFRAQHEIDCLTGRIDGAVEIFPLAFDFDVGLIDAVGVGRRSHVRTNSFLQFQNIGLNSPVDRRAIEREATFIHHFFEIAVAQRITEVPTYAQEDDFGLIVTPLEEIGFGHEQTSE
jgi:hypothetical protein